MLKQAVVILTALLVATVLAVGIVSYLHPMTATVVSVSLSRTLDGDPLADDAPIEWGIVEPDASYRFDDLTVTNTGNVDANITILSPLLPAGWTLTWAMNKTVIAPAASLSAPLILYVAADAAQGVTYAWDCTVEGTKA